MYQENNRSLKPLVIQNQIDMSISRTSSDQKSEDWFCLKKKETEIAYIEDSGNWDLPVF